jgi:hypothetical protein
MRLQDQNKLCMFVLLVDLIIIYDFYESPQFKWQRELIMQFNWLSNLKAVSLKTSWWLKALYVNYPGWFFTKCLNFVSKCIHTWPAATIWQCLIYDPMDIWIKGLAFFLKKKMPPCSWNTTTVDVNPSINPFSESIILIEPQLWTNYKQLSITR